MSEVYGLNPALLALARRTVEKTALVPAGAPGADPSGGAGGAAPMDPSGGMGGMAMDPSAAAPAPAADPAAAPAPADPGAAGGGGGHGLLDPAIQAAIQQAIQQQLGAGGAGAGGKGGKKLEQQIIDTKLWTIQYMLAMIADTLGVKLPPSLVVGPPPDAGSMQAAQADAATMQAGATQVDSGAGGAAPADASAGGASSAIQPPAPIQPAMMSGAADGKTAMAYLQSEQYDFGQPYARAAAAETTAQVGNAVSRQGQELLNRLSRRQA